MTTRAEWKKALKEQERSGKSIVEYCRERGINKSTFQYWRSKGVQGERGKFVAVGDNSAKLEIELSGGARVSMPLSAPAEEIRKLLEAVDALNR